jgi:hypothetical protein
VKPEGNRTRGRPCSRWADNIDMDVRNIGGLNLKEIAVKSENCGRLLRKAMDHKRLMMIIMMMMIIVSLSFQNAEDQDTQINNVTYFVWGFTNNLL